MRGKISLLFLTCALLLAIPAVAAIADTLTIDGDVLNTSNSKNTSFTLCPGVGGSVNQAATVNFQGGTNTDHFATGATVNITASVQSEAQNFITATGASVVTGSTSNPWNNNQDFVSTGDLPLTVDTDWTAGTYKVTYTATGQKAGAAAGTNLTLTDASNITISEATTGCQAPNEAPVVNVVGPEDNAQYEINDVPEASCTVEDEDAGASATPQVDSSGLNSYGLGTQTVTCSYTDSGQETGTDTVTYTIVDTGDPLITHVSDSPASPNGSNQWYTSAVSTTFKAEDFNGSTPTDAGAGFLSPLTNPHNFDVGSGTAEGDNVSNNSGTVEDVAGNVSNNASSGPFKIDLTDPTVSVNLTPAAAATGWYNIATGKPTADFTCNDVDGDNDATNGGASGIATTNGCTPDKTFDEGENQSATGNATDNAGRSDSTPASVSNVDVDLTAPSVGTIVDNNAASSNVCTTSSAPAEPTGFDPSDGGPSGLNASQTGKTWTEPGPLTHPYGTYSYEAHATDNAGNTDNYGPNNYNYTLGIGSGGLSYNGVLQPINMTGTSSIFKLGSTVPVKFTLACGQTSYADAVAKLFVKKSDSTVAGDVNEVISTSNATTGNLFRYDATAGQYIFNLSTKSGYTDANGQTQTFSAGTWQITIKFADGTTKTATFDIKK
jgi:hypothetical protein